MKVNQRLNIKVIILSIIGSINWEKIISLMQTVANVIKPFWPD